MQALMRDCDLLVSCVQNGEAPRLDVVSPWGPFERPSYAMPFSLTGQPALSLCCGFGPTGLPLGIQLIGHCFAEGTVLKAARVYENATGWTKHWPVLATDGSTQATDGGSKSHPASLQGVAK
jgi:aspartyl-tRNA(Asn)/glutamyl-tRNA(Gln) amidotransferase subunit A